MGDSEAGAGATDQAPAPTEDQAHPYFAEDLWDAFFGFKGAQNLLDALEHATRQTTRQEGAESHNLEILRHGSQCQKTCHHDGAMELLEGFAIGASANRMRFAEELLRGMEVAQSFWALNYLARKAPIAADAWQQAVSLLLLRDLSSDTWGRRFTRSEAGERYPTFPTWTLDEVGAYAMKSFMADAPARLNRSFAPLVFEDVGLEAIPFLPKADSRKDGNRKKRGNRIGDDAPEATTDYVPHKPRLNANAFPEEEIRQYLVRTRRRALDDAGKKELELIIRENRKSWELPGRYVLTAEAERAHAETWDTHAGRFQEFLLAARTVRAVILLLGDLIRDPDVPPDDPEYADKTKNAIKKAKSLVNKRAEEEFACAEGRGDKVTPLARAIAQDVLWRMVERNARARANYLVLVTTLGTPPWTWDHVVAKGPLPPYARFEAMEIPKLRTFKTDFDLINSPDVERGGTGYLARQFFETMEARAKAFPERLKADPILYINQKVTEQPDHLMEGYSPRAISSWGQPPPARPGEADPIETFIREKGRRVALPFRRALVALCLEMEGPRADGSRLAALQAVEQQLKWLYPDSEGKDATSDASLT